MADNVQISAGAGTTIATDEAGTPLRHFQYVKLVDGTEGSTTPISAVDGGLHIAGYEPEGAKLLVGTARERFFDNFHTWDVSPTGPWEIVQTGVDHGITGPLGGGAAGSSPYIQFTSGTAINQQTIVRSRSNFKAPIELRFQLTADTRIVNTTFRIGFLEVDPVTGAIITETVRSTAPAVLNARNAVMHQATGTVATTSDLVVRSAGAALDTLATAFGTGFTTIATGTGPNWIAATTYSMSMERDKINQRAWGQNLLTNTGGQFGYDRTFPDLTKTYKLYIIIETGATAPATAVNWRLHSVNLLDATRFDISPRNPGTQDASKAMSVAVVNSPTVTANVAGQTAHDAAVTGNPVRISARALSAAYTTVATGDAADLIATLQGVLITRPYQIPELEWSFASAAGGVINTTDVVLAAAAGAGLRRYITSLTLSNNSATATEVVLKDGATIIWRGHLPANAPNINIIFKNPLKTTANAAMNFACITTAAAVYVNAQGYTAA